MFKRFTTKVATTVAMVKLAIKYKDLAEFLMVLYETIKSKISSESGKLSDSEKKKLKKEFSEAIDNSF